ncbi:hypothetical protein Tco_0860289 [Tanacetum coccineum]|uniref:Reverse transcriptase domain-containing protein n=1 Tax=Tanacetum coccineum TaxID=301880 RepID=A0ABQ5BGR3_9ASTR
MRTRSQTHNHPQQQVPPNIEPFNLEEPIENQAPPIVTMADLRTMVLNPSTVIVYTTVDTSLCPPPFPPHRWLRLCTVSTSSSTPGLSPDVAELKDMVKALLLDKKNQSQGPATVKAVEESCVTYGGAHSYRNCPATDGNVYRDNIQE